MDSGTCCLAPSAPRSDDQIVPAHPGDCWNTSPNNYSQPFLDAWLQMQEFLHPQLREGAFNEVVSGMSADGDGITQSHFLLAKYKIRVLDPEKVAGLDIPRKLTDRSFVDENFENTEHYHAGPVALEYVKLENRCCNRDTCMQILWCCYLPVLALTHCLFGCFNRCCDCLSRLVTNLEENYTFNCCLCCNCCKLAS